MTAHDKKMTKLLIDKLLYFRDGLADVVAGTDEGDENDDEKHVQELNELLEWITGKKI